jgi:hypothetical protein
MYRYFSNLLFATVVSLIGTPGFAKDNLAFFDSLYVVVELYEFPFEATEQ